jgi:hypothetical protein
MVLSSDRAKFLGSKLGRKLGERLQQSRLGKRVSGLAELGSVVGGRLGQMGREKLEGKVKEYIGFEKGGKVMVVEKAHAKPAKVLSKTSGALKKKKGKK